MMSLPKPILALSAAVVAVAWPSPTNIVGAAEAPTPTFEVNFSDPGSVATNTMDVTADISVGPGGVDALRIDECGKRAILPVNINPSVMPEVTMVLGINLVSIATDEWGSDSLGWVLSSDNGGYDRSIVMHDYRFKGMGMPSGSNRPVWETDEQGEVPLNEWLHVVAVYSQTGDSPSGRFYVNGQAAPLEITVDAGDGTPDLVVGSNLLNQGYQECSHWADAWIKEVKIYDSALSSADVGALNNAFQEEVTGQASDTIDTGGDQDDSSSDEDEQNLFGGIVDMITGGEEDDNSDDEDEQNLFEDIVDLVTGSSSHTIVVANGMTMMALMGILFVFN